MHYEQPKRPIEAKYYKTNNCYLLHDRSDIHSRCILQSICRSDCIFGSLFCGVIRRRTLSKGEFPQVRSRKCANQQE